ncbi:MAG TPA: sugar MFS transporter [Candidatus Acidoferrales bacterium]
MAISSVSRDQTLDASGFPQKTNMPALAMVTTLFFMWGLMTCLNDILIPHLKSIFDLNYAEVMLVQFAFFSAYFVFSFPSGKLVGWAGYHKAMVLGLFTMGLGAFLFIPAASVPSFPFFLVALIILAAGMTILQVSANPYVNVLGPAKSAPSRLNLAQAFNSLGTTIAPKLGGILILSAAPLTLEVMHHMAPGALHAYRVQQAASVKLPYTVLGIALVLLGIVIGKFKLPAIAAVQHDHHSEVHESVWRYRHLVLGAIGIFVYVGAEVAVGSFLVNYLSLRNIGNVTEIVAAGLVSFYWGGLMVGRFIGSAVMRWVPANRVLGVSAIVAMLLVCLTMRSSGQLAVWSVISVGLFNSIMFPTIFSLSIEGLGPLTNDGSGVLVAAIIGGAAIPELQGIVADRIGIQHAFFIPALCYLYVIYFAFRGYRRTDRSAA